jgi:hypothetical protein
VWRQVQPLLVREGTKVTYPYLPPLPP